MYDDPASIFCNRRVEPRNSQAQPDDGEREGTGKIAKMRKAGTRRSGLLKSHTFDNTPKETGAGEGIRTLDPNLGKVVLYP